MSEIETIQAYYAASLGKDGRITRTQRPSIYLQKKAMKKSEPARLPNGRALRKGRFFIILLIKMVF